MASTPPAPKTDFQFPMSDSKSFRFGFLDSSSSADYFDASQNPPPPPSVEVLFSEASSDVEGSVDSVVVEEGLTLLKGRVNTSDVFGVSNSDLIPGKYEGGLKLWEGSLDLVKALKSEMEGGRLVFEGKRVLELGCGHGLPGIFAGLKGAGVLHFQDFNAEVLRCLTIPNAKANFACSNSSSGESYNGQKEKTLSLDVRFFAGDWRCIPHLPIRKNPEYQETKIETAHSGYDIILMAETFYSISSIRHLYELTKKCLQLPHGVVYLSGKKHYFGVGGGTRQFLQVVSEDGVMEASLLAQVADGFSNVREVWKLSFRSEPNFKCLESNSKWQTRDTNKLTPIESPTTNALDLGC